MDSLGQRIKQMRNDKGMSQVELGKLVNAEVPVIPPKNLRTTYISLMDDFGIPLPTIQKQAGHSQNSRVTKKHYIRNYTESLRHSATIFHDKLHGKKENEKSDLPNFAQ